MKTFAHIASLVVVFAMALGLITCNPPESPKPDITSISPASAPIGEQVTITGKNLGAVEKINFGSFSTTPASQSATQVVTSVPDGLLPGDLKVSVKAGENSSGTLDFKVLPSVPQLESITPDKGAVGTEITIKGKYLSNAIKVTFDTKDVTTFVSNSDTELKVKVPSELGVGAFSVWVTAAGGTSAQPETFTVVAQPSVGSFTPEVGPVGRLVSISGSAFEGVSKVFFGAGEATEFEYKNNTLIEATVPSSATTGKIKVVTPGGEGLSPKDFIVKDAPKITDFNPKSGVTGATITIDGSGFEAGAVVKFGNGTASDVTIVNGAKITAKVPAAATNGKITVTTAAGTGESPTVFEVIGAPEVLNDFSPQKGPIGTTVVINGKNFIAPLTVKFNNTAVPAANVTVNSAIKITAKVPSGALTGKISVTTGAGTGQSSTNFTVEVPPDVTGFSPPNGLPNSSVIITGTGFSSITSVTFNNIEVGTANFTVNSGTQITATVPANATSGKIKVTNAAGFDNSDQTFYVTPVVSTLSPASASAGSPVTITGTNLENAKVKFNSIEMTPTSNSGTQIIVDSPPTTTGAMNVTVVNAGGTSSPPKTFTGTPPVVVNEVIATANITNQLILLSGSNLLGATKVWFNNTQANVLTVTDKVVTATIPASLAVGSYQVRVETNKGRSTGKTFQVLSTQPANNSGATLTTGSTVAYTAPVAPPVANFWLNVQNTNESFFIFQNFDTEAWEVQFTNSDGVYSGPVIFDNGPVGATVTNNYLEFTINVNEGGVNNFVRYVGTWTPFTVEDDGSGSGPQCWANLTMIETKSGRILKLKVPIGTDCP